MVNYMYYYQDHSEGELWKNTCQQENFFFFSFLIAIMNWQFVADETSELLTDTDTTMILVILWYSYD